MNKSPWENYEPERLRRLGRGDPEVTYAFRVEIDGIAWARFQEVRGLEWKAETVSFYEGGNPAYKVNLVGPGSFSPLTLKKGFFAVCSPFYEWMREIMNGAPRPGGDGKGDTRRTMSIVIFDRKGQEIGRYNIYGAFMSKYVGPGFNANESAVAFEEIEITYDYFEYVPSIKAEALQSGTVGDKR